MKIWTISYADKVCQPELVSCEYKQPYPQLILNLDGKKFFVEFANRSDYWMSASGKHVPVEIISWNRTVRQKGVAFISDSI